MKKLVYLLVLTLALVGCSPKTAHAPNSKGHVDDNQHDPIDLSSLKDGDTVGSFVILNIEDNGNDEFCFKLLGVIIIDDELSYDNEY